MAIVTVDSSSNNLQLESIPLVDLRFLSQSELNSLSLCSDDAFDLRRCDDVVIPKIDRSVFNESAGSRKQTYSRLRLVPREPEITTIGRHRRCAGLLPVPKQPPNPVDDPERKENKRIVSLLRELFARDNPGTDLTPISIQNPESIPEQLNTWNEIVPEELPIVAADGEKKKGKRGRKRKSEMNPNLNPKVEGDGENGSKGQDRVMEIVNRNGVVVDIAALANMEDPFGPELKRRTIGLQTEEELLGFLRGLEGLWGSRRKKRKIVDAGDFGDTFPKGWKLLLSLKRKEGHVWLYCRRYISPNGQQFVSCKEVSSYLLSFFGPQAANLPNSHHSDENFQGDYKLASGNTAGLAHKDDNTREDIIFYPASPVASLSTEHEKEVALLRVENLAEVEIRDLLECHICNMSFDEKDVYLQHLLSSHQRSAKRCRLGTSIGDGVIVKDGKYECQFCHKIFHERHRYNGHVGVHVRNYVKSLEALPGRITVQKNIEPSSMNGVPSGVSKVYELVGIDKGSISQTCTAKPNDEMNVVVPHSKLDTGTMPDTSAKSNHELNVGPPRSKVDTCITPETSTAKSNYELNVGPPHSKLDMGTIPEISTELNVGPRSKLDMDPIPETSTANSNSHIKLDMGTIPETSTAKSNYELNVGHPHSKLDTGAIPETSTAKSNSHSKLDMGIISETTTSKSNYELNVGFPYSKQDAGGSIPQTSTDKLNVGFPHSKLNADSITETSTAKSNYELNVGSPYSQHDTGANKIDETLGDKFRSRQDSGYEMTDGKLRKIGQANSSIDGILHSCLDSATALYNEEAGTSRISEGKYVYASTAVEIDKSGLEQEAGSERYSLTLSGNEQISGVETCVNEVFSISGKESQLDEAKESGNNDPESGFGICFSGPDKVVLTENIGSTDEENILQSVVADTSSALVQSSDCLPTLNMISHKGQDDFCTINQKLENIPGFDELGLDDIEPSKFGFVTGQESSSLPEEHLGLAFDADLEQGLDTSVQFEWETVLPKMDSREQLITVCVWCGTEFNHEAVNPEMQSDSVGFMCPNCKAKISGQLNVLDNVL